MHLAEILATPSPKRTEILLKAIEGSNAMQRNLVEKAEKMEKAKRKRR
jgi:hypothetical protein